MDLQMTKNKELNTLLGTNDVDYYLPSNFVKLLFFKFPNFNNEYYNILEFMSDNFVEIENINEYIESLYNQLKIDDKRIIKDIAKQAQATKWEY